MKCNKDKRSTLKCSVVGESSVQWTAVNCSAINISALWCGDLMLMSTTFSVIFRVKRSSMFRSAQSRADLEK